MYRGHFTGGGLWFCILSPVCGFSLGLGNKALLLMLIKDWGCILMLLASDFFFLH